MHKRLTKWVLAAMVLVAAVAVVALPDRKEDPLSSEISTPKATNVRLVDVKRIGSSDYGDRFLGAMAIVDSDEEDLDTRLDNTLQHMSKLPHVRTTIDFIRWKRSGEPIVASARRKGDKPNILVISIDTLRADHLGCYGYGRPTSPNIDGLADRGALFENAFSAAPWTLPGHMSIFTSLYPSFHKLEARDGNYRLDASEITIGELLKGAGYRTASVVTNPFLDAGWGFDQGFDLYFRHPQVVRAAEQTETATRWLQWYVFHEQLGLEQPQFFLFVHFNDPHEPYDAPQPFGDRYTGRYQGQLQPEQNLASWFADKDFHSQADFQYAQALYDGEISYVDHEIGRLLKSLDQLGLLDSTAIVLTSDHGEEFKDHGGMGHKSTVYVEQLHVPLIITYAPFIAAGQRVSSQASVVDIYPTAAGLVGEEVPPHVQGIDLGIFLAGTGMHADDIAKRKSKRESRAIFAEMGPLGRSWEGGSPKKAIRTERYRLIWNQDQDVKELFDIKLDPAEQRDLYASMRNDPRVRDLERQLTAFIEAGAAYKRGAQRPRKLEVDQTTEEQLRALGYLE